MDIQQKHSNISHDQLVSIFADNPLPLFIWKKDENGFKLLNYNKPAFKFLKDFLVKSPDKNISNVYHCFPQFQKDLIECYHAQKKLIRKVEIKSDLRYDTAQYTYFPPDLVTIFLFNKASSQKQSKPFLKSANKYQNYIEKIQNCVVIFDIHSGSAIFSSPAMGHLTGYTPSEINQMYAKRIFKSIFHKDRKYVGQKIREILNDEKVKKAIEFRIIKKNGMINWVSATVSPINYLTKKCIIAVLKDIHETKKAKLKLSEINQCFLSFSDDPKENINKLTSLCGRLLGGVCSIYNRLEEELLCSRGQWNTPKDYNPIDKPDGHICYDVIKQGDENIWIKRNLEHSEYSKTDPNVIKYKLQTYIGRAVFLRKNAVGAICVVYQKDYLPSASDEELISIIASAIGVEEKRLLSNKVLKESEVVNRALLNATTDMSVLIEKNGSIINLNQPAAKILKSERSHLSSIINLNQPAAKILKSERSHLIGKCIFDFFPVGISKSLNEKMVTVATQKNPLQYTETFEGKVLDAIVYPIIHEKKEVNQFAIHVRDITIHKKIEENLRISEERFRKFFESQPEYCYMISPDGLIMDVNQSAINELGYSKKELVGEHIKKIYAPESHSKMTALFNNWKKSGLLKNEELIIKTKSGSKRVILLSATVIKNQKGKILSSISVQRDITERKINEKKLVQNEKIANTILNTTENILILF